MRKPDMKYLVVIYILLILLVPSSSFSADETVEQALPETLYVIPFLNVMIPTDLSSSLFDAFVDEMMKADAGAGITVRILKQDIDSVDKSWLAQQYFVTGEVFDYAEDSGCCSTELEARARIYYYEPGVIDPAAEIVVPGEVFFDHDISTRDKERARLGSRMAEKLAGKLVEQLILLR